MPHFKKFCPSVMTNDEKNARCPLMLYMRKKYGHNLLYTPRGILMVHPLEKKRHRKCHTINAGQLELIVICQFNCNKGITTLFIAF